MNWIEKQEKLQWKVENCMDELADEFDLEIQFYPAVYYVGKGTPHHYKRSESLKEIVDQETYNYMRQERERAFIFIMILQLSWLMIAF